VHNVKRDYIGPTPLFSGRGFLRSAARAWLEEVCQGRTFSLFNSNRNLNYQVISVGGFDIAQNTKTLPNFHVLSIIAKK
jgi:hypothetical protein